MKIGAFVVLYYNLNLVICSLQKLLGFDAKEIELAFKEESNKRRSDIYEGYSSHVRKHLVLGKEKAQLPAEFTRARRT